MTDQILPLNQDINVVVHEIGDLLAAARSNVARQVNSEIEKGLQQKRRFLPCVFGVFSYNNGNRRNVRSC